VLTWGTAASASCPWLRPQRRKHPWIHVAYSPGYGPIKVYRHADHLVVPTLDIAGWYVDRGFDATTVHVVPRQPPPAAAADVGPLILTNEDDVSGDRVIAAWRAGQAILSVAAVGPAALIASEADGLLVPVGDQDALAAATVRITTDKELARRLAEGGKARFEADFSVEAVNRRWRDLIRKLAP